MGLAVRLCQIVVGQPVHLFPLGWWVVRSLEDAPSERVKLYCNQGMAFSSLKKRNGAKSRVRELDSVLRAQGRTTSHHPVLLAAAFKWPTQPENAQVRRLGVYETFAVITSTRPVGGGDICGDMQMQYTRFTFAFYAFLLY